MSDLVIQMFFNTEEQVYAKNVPIVEPGAPGAVWHAMWPPQCDC
jgi:hypothetical protein